MPPWECRPGNPARETQPGERRLRSAGWAHDLAHPSGLPLTGPRRRAARTFHLKRAAGHSLSDMSRTVPSPYPPRRSQMRTTPQAEPVPQYCGGMPAVLL